jgi:P-type Ca2+ transporter type 2C
MRTLRDILNQFPKAREVGLTDAEMAQSQQQYGANRLTPLPKEPLWKKFLEKFDDSIIKILLAATLLKTVVDLFAASQSLGFVGLLLVAGVLGTFSFVEKLKSWVPSSMFVTSIVLVIMSVFTDHPSYEGLAVMFAVILATGVAFASEFKSDKEFEILNAQKDSIQVKVKRSGEVKQVPLEEIVVGDLIELEMGDEIPADGRITKATELYIDQSLMTGESEPVKKGVRPEDDTADGPENPGAVYRGTQVVDGKGELIVAEVGDFTMIGQIAKRLSDEDEGNEEGKPESEEERIKRKLSISKEQTPLQEKLTDLADLISKVGYIASVAIFVALLIRGLITGDVGPSATVTQNISNLLGYFVYMVIIIVVAVPEGLPMSVTVSLALAMQKMTRANSLVRQLVACETIGSATVICSDKTGTLTQNKMQVDRVYHDGQLKTREMQWPKPSKGDVAGMPKSPQDWMGLNSAVNSTAYLDEKEGKTVVIGNSTEGALLQWLRESGIEYSPLREHREVQYQLHFSSDRKRMTSVIEVEEQPIVLVKGAPEIVLGLCSKQIIADGTIIDLNDADRKFILEKLSEAAGMAMRTLAFAHQILPKETPRTEEALHEIRAALESNLVFSGFVAIRDPLRPDVKDAVADCRAAGIEVKMITGDNIETARAIGKEIGLLDTADSLALTSDEFNKMSDEEVKTAMPRLRILARARPLDKFRMVKLLQEQQHVVAMTGDGTNDAPSLKKADVGLAMGIAGTEVAKEASKIVLLDDSFSTIVKAVMWGRSLYENIQRFVQFQLTINVSALVIAFLCPLVLGMNDAPFTVLQLLWINVIMDTFASIALCSEAPRAGIMKQKPKRRDESIVTPVMRTTILTTASFFIIVMMVLLGGMKYDGWFGEGSEPNPDGWKLAPLNILQVTIFFTIYVMFQVWNQINSRALTPDQSGLSGLFTNKIFLTIAGLIVLGQIFIVTFGGSIFKTQPLDVKTWLFITVGTASVLVFAEIVRQIRKAKMA